MTFFFDNVKKNVSLCYTNEKNTFYENESNQLGVSVGEELVEQHNFADNRCQHKKVV